MLLLISYIVRDGGALLGGAIAGLAIGAAMFFVGRHMNREEDTYGER